MIVTPILDPVGSAFSDSGGGGGSGGGSGSGSGTVLPLTGYFVYWPQINTLTTTGSGFSTGLTDPPVPLDNQPISQLPKDAIVEVNISGRGASQWKRTYDATSPATDVNVGIITPTGYDPINSPYILVRVAGY